jgi:CRISPR-associated protein Cas2
MDAYRLSEYRIMWIFVFFDLPVETAEERKVHTQYRKALLKAGFTRLQFSIYVRCCPSRENATKHVEGMKKLLPKRGKVDILTVTDKQFGDMDSFYGTKEVRKPEGFIQLELF